MERSCHRLDSSFFNFEHVVLRVEQDAKVALMQWDITSWRFMISPLPDTMMSAYSEVH
jgi:hypothetical protein